jgi:hypothetical protein
MQRAFGIADFDFQVRSQLMMQVADKVSTAVVAAMMRVCDMYMQRAFESPPTQLTVNQAAGITVNAAAAAAAAVQPAEASHVRSLVTSLPAA